MTGQSVVYHEEVLKIRKARTIKMLPDQSKWDSALTEKVRSTPYDEHAGHNTKVAFQDRPPKPEDQDGARRVALPRKVCIKA